MDPGAAADAAIRVAGEFFRNPFGMGAVVIILAISALWRNGVAAKNETIKILVQQVETTLAKAEKDVATAVARESERVLGVEKRAEEYRAERNAAEQRLQGTNDEVRTLVSQMARHMPDLKRLQKWTRAQEREEEERERKPRPKAAGEGGG